MAGRADVRAVVGPHDPAGLPILDRDEPSHPTKLARTYEGNRVKPTLGRIVHYRGKQGLLAPRAAIVTATVDSLDPRGVEAGQVPALSSDEHVHLWVYTPAASGPNAATGGFPEFDVPRGAPAEGEEATAGTIPPGSWCWPPRV